MSPRRKIRDDERGEISSALILTPVALLTVMLAIQGALVFHARSLVQTAAQDAARAAQAEGGAIADAETAAARWIVDGGLLDSPEVHVVLTASDVQVIVTSGVTSLVPFWNPTVTGTAAGPVERFRPEPERR